MTILFVALGQLVASRGGIHRVTARMMKELDKRGFRCLYLFASSDQSAYYINNVNDEKCKLMPFQVRQYLVDEHVDVIVDQQTYFTDSFALLFKSFKLSNVKLISVMHASPEIYAKTFTLARLLYNFKMQSAVNRKIIYAIRMLLYPLWKKHVLKGISKMYSNSYDVCSKCVLLTSLDKSNFEKYLGQSADKCISIPNFLSFNQISDIDILNQKSNIVLIVARFDNFEKRLDRALKIWKIIEDNGICNWKLQIVGCGIHDKYLRDLSDKLGLKYVCFEGEKDSEPYYDKAAIFMMTSAVEGWGLTLTESMQKGVVPIAFDSYAALHEIIIDGYNGIIIQDDDIDAYALRMLELMNNEYMRNDMAHSALESCKKFEVNRIMDQWVELLTSIQ